jgi:phosphohistidine swiveling domain-containing protein
VSAAIPARVVESKVWVCDDDGSARFPVFTRGNVGEVFSEAVSPLTWSAYGPHSWELGWRDALYEMGVFTPDEFRPAGQCEILGCFGGYVYLNASVNRVMAVRIPGLTTEAIDQSFFGDYPDVPPYRPDPRDRNAERTAAVGAWLASLFTTDPKPITDRDRARIDALAARRPDLRALPDARLLDYFRSLREDNRHIFKRHLLNTYGCNVLTSVIAQICQAAGAGELASRVTAGVGDVDSAWQSIELWELSRQVRAAPALSVAFDRGVEGLPDRLRASGEAEASGFLAAWETFLGHWGFIGPNVWEFRSPTYRTHPEIPLRMLDRLRQAPDAAAPQARSATLIAEREAAITEVARRLAGDAQAQGQFIGAARSAANYLPARERTKLHCTLMIEEGRAALRELGRRLVERGLLRRWEDLLLVTSDEADVFVADPAAHAGLIEARAARLEVLKAKEPPFVFEGDPPPFAAFKDRVSGGIETAAAGTQLTGIGVSPGRYTGRARVITSLDVDSELEPGEVIVAVITDASWGPLFLAAGAVVVETGATVSHAAIVSRELGIPAAVSVAGATRRIPDGTLVTVDGNTGTVIVH